MSLDELGQTLDAIVQDMESRLKSRDALLGGSRLVITLCSRTIMAIHNKDIKEAARLLEEAGSHLRALHPHIMPQTGHHIIPAEQEYTEAYVLLAIVEGNAIPPHTALGVLPESYVLGLLDVIGELKRHMLDLMRGGRIQDASRIFDAMDGMYGMVYRFSAYDKVLRESRRKLDICRMVMESSRSAITEERRRQDLAHAIKDGRQN